MTNVRALGVGDAGRTDVCGDGGAGAGRRRPRSSAPTPRRRTGRSRGFAVGAGLLIVAFEFEYADTTDDLTRDGAPSLKTGSGNVLLQTPIAILRLPAVRHHRRRLLPRNAGIATPTRASATNTGGGVKITLVGPLRLRVDYRVFKLGSGALNSPAHRIYAGLNLKF